MAKTIKKEIDADFPMDINMEEINAQEQVYTPISAINEMEEVGSERPRTAPRKQNTLISCLRNERVIVRYINRPNTNIQNPKHVLYGGMAETATRTFTVPMLRSGGLINVLTDTEKAFLEQYMGLEPNALSVYLKKDNYWHNYFVRLTKTDTYLNLSIPEDYIKYKVLLANKDYICPSLEELNDRRKETYQFVLINEGDEVRQTNENMTVAMEASVLLGTILNNKSVLKLVVETVENRPISKQSKLDFIQAQAYKAMQANPKLFVSIVKDPYLQTKVLLAECLEYGVVRKRNDLYYLASNSEPLCEMGEESTLSVAAKYLNSPKRQEVKLTLEAKVKALKD